MVTKDYTFVRYIGLNEFSPAKQREYLRWNLTQFKTYEYVDARISYLKL